MRNRRIPHENTPKRSAFKRTVIKGGFVRDTFREAIEHIYW
jgi:hypothetical protein